MVEAFGHCFQNPDLLRQALRHRSIGVPNNERFEFLGDALVNLIVAEALHARWPKADEGALTRARASLVRESALAGIARTLQLGDRIELGLGELKSGGHRRDSILADALEALVAAIHLDAGFEVCRSVVLPWFDAMMAELPAGKVDKDPKTRLQEWLQARQLERPAYALVDTRGQDHERVFLVRCSLDAPALAAEAEGASLRAAEQAAAEQVLAQLEKQK
ncbi:MAG TPA: ribonuclease III [Arenimonas sp.]|uniref:ribonuclease III n=1 Tax=Arenimonas sp. TaxID=1872635 RepID=UPI002C7EDA62|nr:ribonuclease III [Arenimonas sp.]HMB57040.1 ribonuclease III [Arenimonas sp.]